MISEHEELAAKYPAGYVILGIANGAIVEEAKLTDVQIRGDWNGFRVTIDESNQTVMLYVSELLYSGRGMRFGLRRNIERFPLRENALVRAGGMAAEIYYEVLDTLKPVFVIGFK